MPDQKVGKETNFFGLRTKDMKAKNLKSNTSPKPTQNPKLKTKD